jgi:hypothetical protein
MAYRPCGGSAAQRDTFSLGDAPRTLPLMWGGKVGLVTAQMSTNCRQNNAF